MAWQVSFNPVLWILLLSFVFQAIARKIPLVQIPTVIIYIVFGIVITTTHVLSLTPSEEHLIYGIGHFGLFYLMFLSGLEIDIRMLRWERRTDMERVYFFQRPLVVAVGMFLCTILLSYIVAKMIQSIDPQVQAWITMMIFSTTSLGIIMPVLKETDYIRTRLGQTLLVSAFISDILTMLVLSVSTDMYLNGLHIGQVAFGLLLPLMVVIYITVQRIRKTVYWNREIKMYPVIKLQAVLAVLGLFGIVAECVGAESLLGSFLAGILLSSFQLREDNRLRIQLEMLGYSFFVPLFFVVVGMNFHIHTFLHNTEVWAWFPFLFVAAYAVKFLPMLWFGRHFGMRSVIAGGILLSSRLTLVIVACTIGIRLGVITNTIFESMVLVSILTSTVSPITFTFIQRRAIQK